MDIASDIDFIDWAARSFVLKGNWERLEIAYAKYDLQRNVVWISIYSSESHIESMQWCRCSTNTFYVILDTLVKHQ